VPELACKTILHVLEIDQEIMVDLYTKKVLCVHCVEERRGEEGNFIKFRVHLQFFFLTYLG
jgi:hypothetical protein